MTQRLRWGIAGAGKIAHRFACDLVQHAQYGVLHGVASRDPMRAAQFAAECKSLATAQPMTIGSYGSYQALAEDPQVDAVYIALIHPFHRPVTELMLRHGKHVLVEKPAFTTVADWDAMQQLAHANGLLLLEAMKSVVFPAYRQLVALIQQQALPIQHLRAAFGGWHAADCGLPIFDPKTCGGATLDVGVYPLWLYADLCRQLGVVAKPPRAELTAVSPDCQVDGVAIYRSSGALQAELGSAIVADLPRHAELKGPGLTIHIAEKWWNPQHIQIDWQGQPQQINVPIMGGGFQFEADHFAQLALADALDSPILSQSISRQVIGWMEQLLRSHGFAHLLSLG